MTNKEKYKRAFSVLHTSDDFDLEIKKMSLLKRKHKMNVAVATIAACVLFIGGTGTAYAKNIGDIQRTVQLWIHGDQTDATLEFNSDGSYHMSYQDENGAIMERGGGGVAIEANGEERSLSEEEWIEYLNAPEVEYEEDGSVWVYYYDQKIEITDKFDGDGVCYVKVSNGAKTLYMTIEYQNGWSTSPYKYLRPSMFH